MEEKESSNNYVPAKHKPEDIPSTQKKQSRALWILLLVFFAFVATVFLTQHQDTINWVEDYEAGMKLAKQLNKPALLTFYKLHTRFCSEMSQNTYSNADVIDYVEANFVPILIDVDKQPDIAERYDVDYYPTHYIKQPDSNELIGPHVGSDEPSVFIQKLKDLLRKRQIPDQ